MIEDIYKLIEKYINSKGLNIYIVLLVIIAIGSLVIFIIRSITLSTDIWSAITALASIILALLTFWNIKSYRDDKKIDEDKKLATTQLQNIYKLTDILLQYKTTNENLSQFIYKRQILYFMQEYKGRKDFESINKAIKDMEDGKASSFKQHFVGLLEKFQKQTINTIDDFISNNKQLIQKNFDIEEENVKQITNEINELKNKIIALLTEIEMHTMLLPEKAVTIKKDLFTFYLKIYDTNTTNVSNVLNKTSLAPYPAIDFVIGIIYTLKLNLKYIHNTDNFSIEKWKNNWQEVKSPSQKA